MKKLFLLVPLLFLLSFNSFSQPSGRFKNEWINYNQQYLKIVVLSKGIYRISKAQIEAAGMNPASSPEKLQLFHRGEEIAINVDGQTSSSYNFIEFFAINNDGFQDSELYVPTTARFNENYSLYADSTSYFLTLGTNNGKRITNTSAVNIGIGADDYFNSTSLINYSEDYNQNNAVSIIPTQTQSYYEPNDGMCSVIYYLKNNALVPKPFNLSLSIPNYNSEVGSPIQYESRIVSRNFGSKTIAYTLGNITPAVGTFSLVNFNSFKVSQNITSITGTAIPVNYQITTNPTTNDYFSMVYQKAKYPRTLVYSDNLEVETKLNASGTSRLNLSSANAGIIAYDFTDFKNQKKISTQYNSGNTSIDLSIDGTATAHKIWLTHTVKSPVRMRLANFTPIVQSDYDYLIITDPRLKTGAEAYKAYRESNNMNGGVKYKVLIKFAQDLYDEYAYGERNPIAIRRFADYMTSTPAVMKYLFMIGKAYSRTDFLKTSNRSIVDFAPTFGNPGSDNLLTGGLMGNPLNIPAIPTGRLVVGVIDDQVDFTKDGNSLTTAESNQQILNYLQKVNQHEHRTTSAWQKNIQGVVGPKTGGVDGTGSEYFSLNKTLEDIRTIAVNAPFANASSYLTINKTNWSGSSYPEVAVPQSFYDRVNNGLGIVTYYGHGSSLSTSHNIGYVSKSNSFGAPAGGPVKYTNDGKYPLLIAMGCGISNSFGRSVCITSDWINTPGKGAINSIGQSTISYESYDDRFLRGLFTTWFGNTTTLSSKSQSKQKATNAMVNAAIGDILVESLKNEYQEATIGSADPSAPNYDIIFGASFQQTILLGDPAIKLLQDPTLLPLKLTLLEVKAVNENRLIKLNWKTESEVDFNKFEIEKSIDAAKFNKIGEVIGSVSGSEISEYTFNDINPAFGLNYYRLKMIDNDGSHTFSKIVTSEFKNLDSQMKILQNPIYSNKIDFEYDNLDQNSVALFDNLGKKISADLIKLNESKYQLKINGEINKTLLIFKYANKQGIKSSSKILYK